MASMFSLFLIGSILFIARCIIYALHTLYASPLAKIPNAHPTAPISGIWMLWRRFQNREVQTIHSAHQSLGTVVRLGPNELSVNCLEKGVRTIYGGNFGKHEFYPNLFTANSGVAVLFSELDKNNHARRRRLISNIYSKSTLQSSPTFVRICEIIVRERLMPKIQSHLANGGEIEMFFLIVAITMDFITAYQFGLRNGSDFIRSIDGAHWWIELFDATKERMFWPQELPSLTVMLSKLGINIVSSAANRCAGELEAWCLERMASADRDEVFLDETANPEDIPVHYRKLKKGFASESDWADAKKLNGKSREPWRMMAAAELLDNIGGAQEGTATAIFYIMRELARDQSIQASLRADLRRLSPSAAYTGGPDPLPNLKDIDGLPLLQAITLETLRLYPPMAGPQPRVTPPNASIGPYTNLPSGVRISSQPYSLHHNETVFPDSKSWKPERWIEATSSQRVEMMNWFWGFSSGSMMCIGLHFAQLEMKLITAALVSNYTFKIVDDDGTDPTDAYSSQPMKKRLVLKFAKFVE